MTALAKQVLAPGSFQAIPARVYWGCHDSPLGPILLGLSENSSNGELCRIEFASGYGAGYDLSTWKSEWPETEFVPDSAKTAPFACRISQMNPQNFSPATLALYGASFQLKILKAMMNLPQDQSMSYAEIMQLVQKPKVQQPQAA